MKKEFLVAPSILSADFSRLAEEIKAVESAGADWIHVDVMDGHFVPNLTIGAPVVKSIRKTTSLPFDVHLMIENPEKYFEDFAKAGADYLTVHIEAIETVRDSIPSAAGTTAGVAQTLKKIRSLKMKPGLTLRPGTSVERILPYLPLVDLVLIMTVEPGFGGQKFMDDQVEKIKVIRGAIRSQNLSCLIEVDGGVTPETARLCSEADVLVAGSAVYKGNYQENISNLKKAKL